MSGQDAVRAGRIAAALESFAVWARVLDSHRKFPFDDLQLTRAQVETLFLVAHGGVSMTPGALAEALGVTRGAVTQLVSGLTAAGLVEQQRDRADGRRRVLVLSEGSRVRVARLEASLVGELADRFDGLDDAELDTLTVLLARTRGLR